MNKFYHFGVIEGSLSQREEIPSDVRNAFISLREDMTKPMKSIKPANSKKPMKLKKALKPTSAAK